MKEKNIIFGARMMSMLFTPFYLPIVGLIALFTFSYMSQLPWDYKLEVLLLVYIATIFIPTILIHLYRRYQGWTLIELGHKERRMVPYVISILCYFGCYYLMSVLQIPRFMARILVAALVVQVVCALINVWWKISTHTAAIGGVLGALLAFSFMLNFNSVWWLCLVVIASGIVGSSRIILRQHTLTQVTAGFFLGIISAFFTIILI